jgi:two-component system NtrC family sensor kinase
VARAPRAELDISSIEENLQSLQQRIDQLHTTLGQQQRLATIGMMTAVIAHEFNNILTPMLNYARFAVSPKADAALKEKALHKNLAAAEKLAQIAESLLGFTRTDNSTTAAVRTAVSETLSCLSRELASDGITYQEDIAADVAVAMNATQLQQVFMNLIVNARAALLGKPGTKRLTIAAQRTKRDKIVEITIADTGPGIAADVLPHIFEPFFSTKTPSTKTPTGDDACPRGGTGLGLTICHDLITSAGGTIAVKSSTAGTIFTIELPAAAQ